MGVVGVMGLIFFLNCVFFNKIRKYGDGMLFLSRVTGLWSHAEYVRHRDGYERVSDIGLLSCFTFEKYPAERIPWKIVVHNSVGSSALTVAPVPQHPEVVAIKFVNQMMFRPECKVVPVAEYADILRRAEALYSRMRKCAKKISPRS